MRALNEVPGFGEDVLHFDQLPDTGFPVDGFSKTVNIKLSPEAAPLYSAAAQQYRKLKTLLNRLDQLSKTILRHQAKLAESKRQD